MHNKDMACRTWPRIIYQSQIFNYGRSIFLCHFRPKHFRFLWFMPSLGVRSLCIDSYAAVALEITSYPGLSQTGSGGTCPPSFWQIRVGGCTLCSPHYYKRPPRIFRPSDGSAIWKISNRHSSVPGIFSKELEPTKFTLYDGSRKDRSMKKLNLTNCINFFASFAF